MSASAPWPGQGTVTSCALARGVVALALCALPCVSIVFWGEISTFFGVLRVPFWRSFKKT